MIVSEGQSFIDLAIQHCGSAVAAYDLAELNGLSITDQLNAGQTLQLPAVVNKDIAKYYDSRGIETSSSNNVDLNDGRTFDETFDLTFY